MISDSSLPVAPKPHFDYVEVETSEDNETDPEAPGSDPPGSDPPQGDSARTTSDLSVLLRRWKWAVIFFGVILPILGMIQCHGWNEGMMAANMTCSILNGPIARGYADFWYGVVLLAGFTGGLVFLVYGVCLCGITKVGNRIIRRSYNARSSRQSV